MAQGVRNSSSAQVASTLACYLNPAIYFAQPLVLFAVDSIINDLALLVLSWRNEADEAANAQEAQFAADARAATTTTTTVPLQAQRQPPQPPSDAASQPGTELATASM